MAPWWPTIAISNGSLVAYDCHQSLMAPWWPTIAINHARAHTHVRAQTRTIVIPNTLGVQEAIVVKYDTNKSVLYTQLCDVRGWELDLCDVWGWGLDLCDVCVCVCTLCTPHASTFCIPSIPCCASVPTPLQYQHTLGHHGHIKYHHRPLRR